MDVSTRKLRYFVAVAEELHFSRAAARLFVAQQALSKQVRELEDAIGAELLRRTTRSVELTPAGEVFLAAARSALETIDAGVESAQRAAVGDVGILRLGFIVGGALELTGPILTEFAEQHPGVHLELQEFGFDDPGAGLGDGTSDVAFVRLPSSVTEIDSLRLFVEPLVLAIADSHPLAQRTSVSTDEVLAGPIIVGRTADDAWQRFWTLDSYRAGASAPVTKLTNSLTEELSMVAAGVGCTVTAAGVARYAPHQGIAFVPIDAVEGSAVAVGWPKGRSTPLMERFVKVADAVRQRESKAVALIEHPFASTSIGAQ